MTYDNEAALFMDEVGRNFSAEVKLKLVPQLGKVLPNAFLEIRPKYPSGTTLSLYVVKHTERKTINHKECTCYRKCPTRDSTFTRFRCVRIVGGEHTITYVIAQIKAESAYNGTSIR